MIAGEKVIKDSHITAFNSNHKANFCRENATITGFNSKHGAIPRGSHFCFKFQPSLKLQFITLVGEKVTLNSVLHQSKRTVNQAVRSMPLVLIMHY